MVQAIVQIVEITVNSLHIYQDPEWIQFGGNMDWQL